MTSRTVCSAVNCHFSKSKNPNLTFHRFPKDRDTRRIWISTICDINFFQKDKECNLYLSSFRICSNHFKAEDFKICGYRKILKKNAIPSKKGTMKSDESYQDASASNADENISSESCDMKRLDHDYCKIVKEHFVSKMIDTKYDDEMFEDPSDITCYKVKEIDKETEKETQNQFFLSGCEEVNDKVMKLLGTQFDKVQLPPSNDSDLDDFSPRRARQEGLRTSGTDCDVDNPENEPEEKPAKEVFSPQPVGQLALHSLIDQDLPLPAVRSYINRSKRWTYQDAEFTAEYYPVSYTPEDSVIGHLRFALRHEPCDLGIICAALHLLGPDRLTEWVNNEPAGAESRRAWFFYETLTGEALPVENTRKGDFVDALSEKYHYVALPRDSPRHRVRDNLLGTRSLCPTLRRTPKLEAMRALRLEEEARRLTNQCPPETLNRAVNFFMNNETRSTFALEGEVPSRSREERFLLALHSLSDFNPMDKSAFIGLQNIIVEPNYTARDWRDFQNFIGQTTCTHREIVHFICPRPEDVPDLMDGWMTLTDRLLKQEGGTVDAVLAAAVSSFAFNFIHPFEDGNGRIHRFLMHYVLKERGFTPPNIFLPISASILREKRLYDAALEVFSKAVMAATDWDFTDDHSIVVENETRNLFRYFDATAHAEYLYGRVENTIRHDLKSELDYLVSYDDSFAAVQQIVQLPDRRIDLLVRLLIQSKGRLSRNKRRRFSELKNSQIDEIETAVGPLLPAEINLK